MGVLDMLKSKNFYAASLKVFFYLGIIAYVFMLGTYVMYGTEYMSRTLIILLSISSAMTSMTYYAGYNYIEEELEKNPEYKSFNIWALTIVAVVITSYLFRYYIRQNKDKLIIRNRINTDFLDNLEI
jgi:hypothetical protein